MFRQLALDLGTMVAAQPIIAPDGVRPEIECCKHETHAVESRSRVATLRTESGSDERARALREIDDHLRFRDSG